MTWEKIEADQFSVQFVNLWEQRWLLLTSGDWHEGKYNSMTVGWGSFGVMWGRPFVQVVVRPTRYTFEFMEKYDSFTLAAFPDQYKKALQFLGRKSGRDGDKLTAAGLTAQPSELVAAPSFAESELVFECRKIYYQDIDASHFLDSTIELHYPQKDYHRVYFGQILCIRQKV
ncbi:MAG: flavin reductase family protein [Calditrichaeota bacterium]|nr:MAG: flavin reductase family protein [Calditrichota bacterium]